MHHHYLDIITKLGKPLWWDEYAVPRYCEFFPKEGADIYASEIVLLEIACQDCGQLFKVCMSWSDIDGMIRNIPPLSQLITNDEIHYGDPPNYGCCLAGPTMNSIPKRVIEFWRKENGFGEMKRIPELEREIKPDWAEG